MTHIVSEEEVRKSFKYIKKIVVGVRRKFCGDIANSLQILKGGADPYLPIRSRD